MRIGMAAVLGWIGVACTPSTQGPPASAVPEPTATATATPETIGSPAPTPDATVSAQAQAAFESAAEHEAATRIEDAIAAYRQGIALAPHVVAERIRLARLLVAVEEHQEALAAVGAAVDAAPDRPEAWDAQGEVELAAGRLDEAEASFRRALDLAADFTSPYDGLAAIAFHRGDLHGGIAQLQAGLHATTAVTPPGARIRLLEQLGEAQMIVGQEQAAFDAIARSVEAQGLQDAPVVEAVTHLGRARLLWRTKRWTRARTEALAAREGAPPPFVRWVSTALEASLGALAGDGSAAASALDDVRQGIGHDHPLTLEPAFYVAIANDRLDEAAAALLQLDTVAPYRSDEARLALAHAMVAAQRNDEARALLTVVSRRYRRSVSSAVVRREATAMLETLA